MKTREDYVKVCQRCEKRAMSMKLGIICTLTQQPADYETPDCPSFVLDEKVERLQNVSAIEQANEAKNNLSGGILFVVVGVIWLVIGISLNRFFYGSILMIIGGIAGIARQSLNKGRTKKKLNYSDETLDEII